MKWEIIPFLNFSKLFNKIAEFLKAYWRFSFHCEAHLYRRNHTIRIFYLKGKNEASP